MDAMEGDDNFNKVKKTSAEQTKDKYGGEADGFSIKDQPGMEKGLNRDRKLTDILMLILFIAFIVAMGFCTSIGFKNGNVNRLMAPLDSSDNFCGETTGFESYKYLYLQDLSQASAIAIFNSGLCVKKCPTAKDEVMEGKANNETTDVSSLKAKYATMNVVGYCFPASGKALPAEFKDGWAAAKKSFLSNPVGAYFNDMYLSSTAIYASFGMGVVYCFIYIYLMSMFAETIAWICVALTQIALIGLAVGFWFLRAAEVTKMAENTNWTKDLKESSNKKQIMFLTGCIVSGIVAAIFACCVYCGFQSLKLAIDVIDAAADFLAKTKRIILTPILYFVLTLIVILIWASAMCCVASMNTINADTSVVPQNKDVKWDNAKAKWMALFMLFGLLWICAWLKYSNQFVCMVSASTYYFNSNKDMEGEAEVALGFKYAHVYHTGSIAAGAFIIAIVQMIRIVFMYLAKQAEKASGDNAAIKLIVACGSCILKCIEKICDYLNSAAFCYMAITGDSFCSSAWNGFLLNVKHTLKFGFANIIAKVFMLLGKVAICVGNCFSLYFIMSVITKDTSEVSSLTGPMVAVALVTFLTASIFLGLFDTAVMSMMTCLAVDMDLHDGHPEWGPPTFHDGLDKAHEKEEAQTNKVNQMM